MGGDDGAAAFCSRVRPKLVGALSLHCGDADVAEELAQEALARAWDRWAKVREMDNPEGWVWRVGVNLASSHYRRKAAERRARAKADARETLVVLDDHADPNEREAVRRAVAGLPDRQRTALVLRYFSDLSVEETAQIMGCATGTVKSLTHRAIGSLRDHPALTAFDSPLEVANDVA